MSEKIERTNEGMDPVASEGIQEATDGPQGGTVGDPGRVVGSYLLRVTLRESVNSGMGAMTISEIEHAIETMLATYGYAVKARAERTDV